MPAFKGPRSAPRPPTEQEETDDDLRDPHLPAEARHRAAGRAGLRRRASPSGVKLSPLAGFWRTEVGTLNQIIHIWPYKDLNERDHDPRRGGRDEGLAAQDRRLRPRHGEQDPPSPRRSRRTSSRASMAASTSSAPTPTAPGVDPQGDRDAGRKRIKAAHAPLSPLIFAGFTDIGTLNQWVHVWAYKNMGERERIRGEAVQAGIWPPPRDESVHAAQADSTLAIPAKFSPLQARGGVDDRHHPPGRALLRGRGRRASTCASR